MEVAGESGGVGTPIVGSAGTLAVPTVGTLVVGRVGMLAVPTVGTLSAGAPGTDRPSEGDEFDGASA